MKLALALVVLACGIVLTVFGVNASHSLSSDVSRFFTGTPTDRSVWLIVSGVVLMVAGGAAIILSGGLRRPSRG